MTCRLLTVITDNAQAIIGNDETCPNVALVLIGTDRREKTTPSAPTLSLANGAPPSTSFRSLCFRLASSLQCCTAGIEEAVRQRMNSRPACCMHAVRVRRWHDGQARCAVGYLVLVSVRSSLSSSVLRVRVPILRKIRIRIRIRGKHDYTKDLEEAGDLEPSLLVGSLWSVEGSVRQVFQSTSLEIGERHAGSGWQLDRIRRGKRGCCCCCW